MRPLQATLPLRRVPRAPVAEVLVAVTLELVPTVVTRLGVCSQQGQKEDMTNQRRCLRFALEHIFSVTQKHLGKSIGGKGSNIINIKVRFLNMPVVDCDFFHSTS